MGVNLLSYRCVLCIFIVDFKNCDSVLNIILINDNKSIKATLASTTLIMQN